MPGLTSDRYGDQLLVQSFHQSLELDQLLALQEQINQALKLDLHLVYNDRIKAVHGLTEALR